MITNRPIHPPDGPSFDHAFGFISQLFMALPFILALVMYLLAVLHTNRQYKSWPIYRTICWAFGVIFAIFTVAGPLANRGYTDFTAHMFGHLLLGMLAPLLMALGAPITLVLRTLSVPLARRLTKVLRSWPSRIFTHPLVATCLNIGGLWLFYTTSLYSLMHKNIFLHLVVHFHFFLAGYLFTVSIIYIDPIPHRIPFLNRAIVLVAAIAGHGILSKYIYAHPPEGVLLKQAEIGGMLMYYGGDVIDIVLIFILCLHWFKATRPHTGLGISLK